jgi:gamma-glutamylcyclotransferase (GGCT)/AIG2-like uncharacterized protein YtfP
MPQYLFSYGTLQDTAVQQNLFNRVLKGRADAIEGYKLSSVVIRDDEVVLISGLTHHLILVPGSASDTVTGMVFELTDDELLAADHYEAEDYRRVQVSTTSGGRAWVYVQAYENPFGGR